MKRSAWFPTRCSSEGWRAAVSPRWNAGTRRFLDEVNLLEAVEEALRRDAALRSAKNDHDSILERFKSLTPREYEILTYVITGMLNKQIAYTLDISEKTVKVHRGRVMEKLGVDSVAELVRLSDKANIQPAQVPDS